MLNDINQFNPITLPEEAKVESFSYVVEPVEFIRNIDMIIYYSKKTVGYFTNNDQDTDKPDIKLSNYVNAFKK
jgi:hypothetical protein